VSVAVKTGLIAISAALAISIPALATAIAQSRIGAAMAGAIAERPELVGTAIILVAIPETMVILGLVIAFIITGLKTVTK
jgi:V/A-type H+-transporting ATPase subunit K